MEEEHEFEIHGKDFPGGFAFASGKGPHRIFKKFAGPRGFAMNIGDCCGSSSSSSESSQVVKDDLLHVVIRTPGLDKSTIKIRAKSDKMTLEGTTRSDLIGYLGEGKTKLVISLEETVDPNEARADYRDGIMHVTFPIINPRSTIPIE